MTGYSSSNNPVYSIGWANSIIEKLLGAHARASEIVLKKLHMDRHQVALLLACHRQEYYLIRETIRRLDRNLQNDRLHGDESLVEVYTTHALSVLVNNSRQHGLDSFHFYLTAHEKGPKIKEPVNRGLPDVVLH